jgi:hypothetical protein
MKKILIFSIMMLGLHLGLQAATVILTGSLGTIELTTDNCYILRGCAVVENGDTLTINPGVEIRCESGSSLTIEQGGKIYSNGNSTTPVVFTSDQAMGNRAPGDWVGITLNGYAKNNVIHNGGGTIPVNRCSNYNGGGMVDNDNSGSITYTRIEFAGQALTGYNYTDALVLNSIGSATIIEGVQITQSAGNGLSLLGGKVNVDKVYVLDAHKHGVHISDGYTGYMQSLLVQTKDPNAHDAGGTHALYLQNNFTANNHSPLTQPTISNATLMGPLYCDPEASVSSDFKNGIHFTNNGGAHIYNSVITGFNGYGLFIADIASAERTLDNTLNASFISLKDNRILDYGHDFSIVWNEDFMCAESMQEWFEGFGGSCEEEENQLPPFNPNYDNSLCGNFCDENFVPNFILHPLTPMQLSDPDYTSWSAPGFFTHFTYRGALQDTSVFGSWISSCALEQAYCQVMELKQNIEQPMLTFVPNPATNHTTVHFYSDITGHALVNIVDNVTGRVLCSKTIKIEIAGVQKVNLNLEGLKENIYSVQVILKSKVIHGHLIVK